MKKYLIALLSLIFITLHIHGEREITSFDIARWYLDADLVIISSLVEFNTVHTRSIDTASTGGYSIKCDFMRDKYLVFIDSILKGHSNLDTILIITPEYAINCSKYKISDSVKIVVNHAGDTTFLSSVTAMPFINGSSSYFRFGTANNNIVFLKNNGNSSEIIYVMHDINDKNLKFLNEVEKKGEKYFDIFKQNGSSGN